MIHYYEISTRFQPLDLRDFPPRTVAQAQVQLF